MSEEPKHWLVRPENIRKLWIAFIVILVLTVIPDPFIKHHDHYTVEAWIGFNAFYGLATCVLMILAAKALGSFLKRKDDYYDE